VSVPDQSACQNRLLSAMSPEAFARLQKHMTIVDLPLRHVLVTADVPVSSVCFLETGLGSMIATSSDDERIEVVGPEGMSSAHVCLATLQSPNQTFMQVAGTGIQVPIEPFLELMDNDQAARSFFLNYVHSCDIQLAQSALANGRYNINERLARWLLMCHDRMDGNELPLTHEFLALMLGVRRSAVTNEIHILEGLNAIKATRALIRIKDRPKLEEIAGGCYGVAEREYERLLGLPLKRNAIRARR